MSGHAESAVSIAACSCGVVGCAELGWPHEWDPIATGDSCVLASTKWHGIVVRDGRVIDLYEPPHRVREPYVRLGSGYACAECVARQDGYGWSGWLI